MSVPLATPEELTAFAGSVDPTMAAIVLGAVSGAAVRLASPISDVWTSPDTVPVEVKGLILQIATRVVSNPAGRGGETAGASSYTMGSQPVGIVLTDAEKQAILEAAGLAYEGAGDTMAVSLRPARR